MDDEVIVAGVYARSLHVAGGPVRFMEEKGSEGIYNAQLSVKF